MTATANARPTTSDHKPKKTAKKTATQHAKANARRAEVSDEPIDFDFDGDSFTFKPSDATSLDFLAALEDEELIKACRLLLGREQATKLFHGRSVTDLMPFFDAMGEAADVGNP
jgi:hypothetical protein